MDNKTAVKRAMASMEMEGFVFTQEEKELFAKLERGEISSDDIRNILFQKVVEWKKINPEHFTENN